VISKKKKKISMRVFVPFFYPKMAFNSLLKNIIAKTVQEYSDAASIDPEKFEPGDTYTDDQLNVVLEKQEEQKRQLWADYYKVKRDLKDIAFSFNNQIDFR
jgi:hypothetical protein